MNPRRPLNDAEPDGYQESDRDYVLNNLDLAVRLLDAYDQHQSSLLAPGEDGQFDVPTIWKGMISP